MESSSDNGPPSRLTQERRLAEAFDEFQLALQSCMREQGFDYQPEKAEAVGFALPTDALSLPVSDFASEHGWGVVTIMQRPGTVTRSSDPNESVLLSLSPSELLAWRDALQDCTAAAGQSVQEAGLAIFDSERQLKEVEALFQADPRVVEANDQWSRCMAQNGFNFATPDAAADELGRLLREAHDAFAARLREADRGVSPVAVAAAFLESDDYADVVAQEVSIAQVSLTKCGLPPPIIERPPELASIFSEIYRDVAERS